MLGAFTRLSSNGIGDLQFQYDCARVADGIAVPERQGPGVSNRSGGLPDERRAGARDLRRQGRQPSQPGGQLLHRRCRRRPPHRRLDARNCRRRLHRNRQRSRRVVARSPLDQGRSAEIQLRAQRRQDVSLSGNHHDRRLPARRIHAQTTRQRGETLRSLHQCEKAARDDRRVAEDFPFPNLLARHRRAGRTLALVSAVPAGEYQSMHGSLQPADRQRGLPERHPPAADVPRRQQRPAVARVEEGDDRGVGDSAV